LLAFFTAESLHVETSESRKCIDSFLFVYFDNVLCRIILDINEFIELTKKISGSSIAYERYVYSKSNEYNKRELLLSEGKKLYIYLKEYLQKIRKSVV